MTGSSARNLKNVGANLLAGRAGNLQMFPLTTHELGADFDLLKYCRYGGLPIIYNSSEPWIDLQDYIHLYLKEEIISEAIVRRVDHYARFLDVFGQCSGEELNYEQIANDSNVPARTVSNFVEVLKDTLLAYELEPFKKTNLRKATSKSKVYLFDVGVANYLSGRKDVLYKSEAFGKSFEHFIMQEIRAYLGYRRIDAPMKYWRTVGGKFEVDCIIADQLALEIKGTDRFQEKMLTSLMELKAEKKIKHYYLISRDPVPRSIQGIHIIPYNDFLERLWKDELL